MANGRKGPVSVMPAVEGGGRYSVRETCELLGIHRNWLALLTKSGDIGCVLDASGRKRYKGVEIRRWWLAHCGAL